MFNDEDLKRLIEHLKENERCGAVKELLPALLARLEAAELAMEHGKLLRGYLGPLASDAFEKGSLEVWDRRYEAWRKAAGR